MIYNLNNFKIIKVSICLEKAQVYSPLLIEVKSPKCHF